MRILFCTNAYDHVSNGPAKFAHLLQGISNAHPSYTLRILTEDAPPQPEEGIYPLALSIPKALKPLGMFIRMFAYHNAAMDIRKNDYPFDILIYNNAIVSLRSALTFKKTIGFINDDNNASVSWKDGFTRFRWSRAHIFFITEWLALRWCKKIVVNSQYLQTYINRRYRVPKNKTALLYKAIEIQPEIHQKPNEIPEILFVKNDYVRGGLFTLIKALQILETPLILHVAGPPETALSEISIRCADSNIQLHFHGIISQSAVYDLMRRSDVFCVPSHREALGVANIEAIALGCAIVSTNVGGIPEVLNNRENGWMVPPNDPESLATALHEAISNSELREKKSQAGQRSLHRFSTETMFNDFIKIISKDAD